MTMMMMTPPHPVQMNGIVYPHPHDVLCGRGTSAASIFILCVCVFHPFHRY